MHEEPQVPNYRLGRKGRKLEPGLCLAIEPMLTLGSHDTRILEDDWTIVTRDGTLAAHFEHTIARKCPRSERYGPGEICECEVPEIPTV